MGDKFGCISILMFFLITILCGGGAGVAFKSGMPLVGIPMFILGVILTGVWVVMWIAMVKAARKR